MSLLKLKTKKSASKRILVKKKFLQRKQAYKSHLILNKSAKRLNRLSSLTKISLQDTKKFLLLLPYR
jgi:ribosomal protein L35